MDDLDRLLEKRLQDPEFRKEWEATQLEYDVTEMLIKARTSQNISQKELAPGIFDMVLSTELAKDAHAANLLQGSCEKVYFAAVEGVTDEAGTIDAPIAREQESVILRCVRADGRPAVTHYRRIACNGRYSLLEIRLETGRTHQIRVHFAHIGHPLAGDDMYGGSTADIARQALHCGRLTFVLPLTGGEVTAESELPEDIRNLLELRAKN